MTLKPESEVGTGTAIRTFLIADIRGYTAFTAEHGDEAAATLAGRFAAVARAGVEAFGGEVVELRGDEALVVFESARQAIRAAIQLQRRFVDETVADPTMPLPVGIGLDAGEAVAVENGYRGGALNLAARLCAMAPPAEILASREVVHLARKVEGIVAVDRGPVRLKGLADPVDVIRLRAEADDPAEELAFRRALGPAAARLTPAVPGAMVPNPYKGLRAFEEADAEDFFGREELTQQLVERLGENRFLAVVGPTRLLAVVGPSGSGKSSVVRAGLIPAIRRGALPGSSTWLITEMIPGAHPLEGLEAALLRVAVNPPSSLMEQLERDDHGLLRAVKRVVPADGSELVLLIDQFEEVFTLVHKESVRTHFLESLEAAVTEPNTPLRVVITMRADFYDRPLLYRGFAELLRNRVEAVVPLSPEELEHTIAGPAKRVDVRLEEGLVAKMLSDVGDQPGGLPLLEYALTELFERREGNLLTFRGYRSIGGVSGALGRRAEELFATLDETGWEACRQIFLRLVSLGEGTEDTRRPVPRSEIVSVGADVRSTTAVIDSFGSSRLLSFDRDTRTGVPTVELAHEALLTAWGRLRGWIDEARDDVRAERRLAIATKEWGDAERDRSFLVSGSRLEQFDAWRKTSRISLTPEEGEFLDASLAERDRRRAAAEAQAEREQMLERRSLRRMRAIVAVLAVAGVIAAVLTLFAFNQRARAEREGRVALARELAAASAANLEEDPERSIILALQAIDTTRSVDGTVLPEAENALHRAVVASRIVLSVPGLGGSVDWSPARDHFVTEGPEERGLIDIRDTNTGKSLLKFHAHDVDVNFVVFSNDGSMLGTTGDDGAMRVWNPNTGDLIAEFQGPEGPVVGPSFSPDGSLAAASWIQQGEIRIWYARTGNLALLIPFRGSPFNTAFSPDGQRLAVTSFEPSVTTLFDVSSGKPLLTLRGQEFGVGDVGWSPNGRWIATSSNDGTARIWDGESGRLEFTLFGHKAPLAGLDWSPDSRRLVTGSQDGTAKVWQISEGGAQEVASLAAQDTRSGVVGVAFSPDGSQVLTGDNDIQAAKIWDVGSSGNSEWATLPGNPYAINSADFAPDGEVVTSGPAGSIRLWDSETGRRIGPLPRPGAAADPRTVTNALKVSPDGALIAGAVMGDVWVWDRATRDVVFSDTTGPWDEDVAWSPDGEVLAIASTERGGTRIVDRSWKQVVFLKEDPDFGPHSLAFSPDGRLLATAVTPTGRPDPTAQFVSIWDWKGETREKKIPTLVETLAFDPRGARLAVANFRQVQIFSVATGRGIITLGGGSGGIGSVAYSPDGTRVAAGSFDGTVRIWNADSGERLLVLEQAEPVTDVAFSVDGSKLVSASGGGMTRVWALDLDDLIKIARQRLTRTLTMEECQQFLHGQCPEE
jgi:WD40 repeat protein/class 3 adenylate cyclase